MCVQELGKDTSVLMGANIANEVAAGCFCETTVGYNIEANGLLLKVTTTRKRSSWTSVVRIMHHSLTT